MQELVLKLGIDWKLLIAQAVNFAILVYVLQRFVYKPIVKALNGRQEDISKAAHQGEEIEAKLKETEALKEEVLAKARQESDKILKSAEEFALTIKEAELEKTKKEVEKMIASGKAQIESDRASLRSELKKEMGQLISLAVEKTVGDVVDASGQKKLAEEALEVMKHAHAPTKK
jgi:F-type H+-transporting ATPase subunit b